MLESLVTIQYFLGSEIISMSIPREELPQIAGHATYWRQDVLDQDEEERRGKALKTRIGKTLKHNALFPKSCEKQTTSKRTV